MDSFGGLIGHCYSSWKHKPDRPVRRQSQHSCSCVVRLSANWLRGRNMSIEGSLLPGDWRWDGRSVISSESIHSLCLWVPNISKGYSKLSPSNWLWHSASCSLLDRKSAKFFTEETAMNLSQVFGECDRVGVGLQKNVI